MLVLHRLFVRDKRKLKTQVKENTTRPEWNEEFQLLVHEPEHQFLSMIMYDHDVLSVDDEIGRASFAIRNLRNGEEEEVDVKVVQQATDSENQMMVSLMAACCCPCDARHAMCCVCSMQPQH